MITYLKEKTARFQESWSKFADIIGLSLDQIVAIRANSLHLPSPEQKLARAIEVWYENYIPLERFVCGLYKMKQNRIADTIAKKYCAGRKEAELCETI